MNPPPAARRRFRAHCRPVFAALAALLVTLGWSSCGEAPTPQAAANAFFLKISAGQFAKAYESASFAFQAQISPESFQDTAKELGLAPGSLVCRWYGEEIRGRDARLTGDLVSGGKSVPILLRLLREQGQWRVFSVVSPRHDGQEEIRFSQLGKSGGFVPAANYKVPPEALCRALIKKELLGFNRAILTANFADFYASVSPRWQHTLSEAQLQRTFQSFIDAKVDFTAIEHLEPVLDAPPAVNSEGILVLNGHYNLRPYRLFFILQFVYELPNWKLYGVDVQLKADTPGRK